MEDEHEQLDDLRRCARNYKNLINNTYTIEIRVNNLKQLLQIRFYREEFTHIVGLDHCDDMSEFKTNDSEEKVVNYEKIFSGNMSLEDIAKKSSKFHKPFSDTYNLRTNDNYTLSERIKILVDLVQNLDKIQVGQLFEWDNKKAQNISYQKFDKEKNKYITAFKNSQINAAYALKIPLKDDNVDPNIPEDQRTHLFIFLLRDEHCEKKEDFLALKAISAFADSINLTKNQNEQKIFSIIKTEDKNKQKPVAEYFCEGYTPPPDPILTKQENLIKGSLEDLNRARKEMVRAPNSNKKKREYSKCLNKFSHSPFTADMLSDIVIRLNNQINNPTIADERKEIIKEEIEQITNYKDELTKKTVSSSWTIPENNNTNNNMMTRMGVTPEGEVVIPSFAQRLSSGLKRAGDKILSPLKRLFKKEQTETTSNQQSDEEYLHLIRALEIMGKEIDALEEKLSQVTAERDEANGRLNKANEHLDSGKKIISQYYARQQIDNEFYEQNPDIRLKHNEFVKNYGVNHDEQAIQKTEQAQSVPKEERVKPKVEQEKSSPKKPSDDFTDLE